MVRLLVLDTSAVFAFFNPREKGHQNVVDVIKDPDWNKEFHALNAVEYFRIVGKEKGLGRAEEGLSRLRSFGIRIVDDLDEEFWKDLAFLKIQFKQDMSIGDCAVLALARKRKCPLLGSDSAAFEGVYKAGMVDLKKFR